MGGEILHKVEQEVEHLETFEALINDRKIQPPFLNPVCGIAGFGLDVVTAAMVPKIAMACTIAVEGVLANIIRSSRKISALTKQD